MSYLSILRFELDDRNGGLLLADVVEVVRAVAVTPLARTPRAIEGVIDVRGTIVPVIDLRARFGLPRKKISPSDRMIICRADDRRIALRVDHVSTIVALDSADVHREVEAGPGLASVAGVARLPDGLLLIHDVDAFLSETERAELDAVLPEAAR